MIPAHDGSVEEARCIALRANCEMAAMRPSKPVQPPACEGNSPTNTQCPTHGRSSTLEDRRDPTKRVVGSGSTF
jgi:hypothetical protein